MPNSSQTIEKLQKARSLLTEVEKSLASGKVQLSEQQEGEGKANNSNLTGVFDGQFLVTDEGKKYQVPPNYASKSQLVVGDRLELVKEADDSEGSQNFVKPIKKIERTEVEGILTKKDYQWAAVTGDSTYWVLPASVEYYNGEIGDKVKLLLPADYEGRDDIDWAAVQEIVQEKTEGGLSGEIVLEGQEESGVRNQESREDEKRTKMPNPMRQDVEELR